MTHPDISLAFFDSTRGVQGTLRDELTIIFDQAVPQTLTEEMRLTARGDGGYDAACADRFELGFSALSEPVELERARVRICRVSGRVENRRVDCLGTATETLQTPAWGELAAIRVISAVADAQNAAFCLAERPRGALGHGDELVTAAVVSQGTSFQTNDARISTVYDSEGRQRSASAEIWINSEDFPRRLSGWRLAQASVMLGELQLNSSVFAWRLQGVEAVGAYEILIAQQEPRAA